MPIQVDPPKRAISSTAAVVLAVLGVLGIVVATNWLALPLVVVMAAAVAGYFLHG